MNSTLFLALRRMRAPIITLIVIYATSVVGLTLAPCVDAMGKMTAPLSFFLAFYFICYMATTIGSAKFRTPSPTPNAYGSRSAST